MIHFLRHSEIDKRKWDSCIEKSCNGLVYAFSWYLDVVSPGWEAIADTDYNAVMPLPVKSKFGLRYIVQPVFTQQLGVFSIEKPSETYITECLNYIPKKYFRQVFNLNTVNVLPPSRRIMNRTNFELDLNNDYRVIHNNFNENTQRNIRKARGSGVLLEKSEDVDLFMDQYFILAKEKPNQFGLQKLRAIVTTSLDKEKGKIIFARNTEGLIIAGVFFLNDMGRIIYVTSFTTAEGQDKSSMFLIMDEMISKYAGSPYILDFEGSMIPGVARFFAGFGAQAKIYQQYRKGI